MRSKLINNYLNVLFKLRWSNILKLHQIYFVFVLSFMSSFIGLNAQGITVNGKVTTSDGIGALPGVTVLVKGTNKGVSTDFDGHYTLEQVAGNSTLVFSYIGYVTQEVLVNNRSTIDVVMKEDIAQLNEIVLIDYGYGKVKRDDMTGSVASMSSKELSQIPVANVAEALSGRLPGVNEPGAQVNIRVRGGGSITQDNSPLYVVDGFIVGDISDIPPNDIASIDVLKDAAATAVYGAQASNGVIVITTKSPVEGKISISYSNFFQFNTLPTDRAYKVLSPYEFVLANYEYKSLPTQNRDNYYRYDGRYED